MRIDRRIIHSIGLYPQIVTLFEQLALAVTVDPFEDEVTVTAMFFVPELEYLRVLLAVELVDTWLVPSPVPFHL